MDGYYVKDVDDLQEKYPRGRLRIDVTNIPDLHELLQKAEKEARQLNETLSRLRNFELDVNLSIAGPTSDA